MDYSVMTGGLLTNCLEENKVNDQHHMTEQNKFQRLNIYMLKKRSHKNSRQQHRRLFL